MSAITIRRLTKRYGPTTAVDDLTFDVDAGTVTAFLGPNGAGKTTTMRVLLGLAHADSGDALIAGQRYRALDHPLRQVGTLIDGAGFHPGRTARNHLRTLAAAAGLAARRVDEVLDAVELTDAADRKVGGFSLGMRRRLGLACALIGQPDVLVLDEPANGLDPAGIRWLRDFLRGFAAQGGTVLISSHVLAEVAQTADDVVVVNGGQLIVKTAMSDLTRARSVVVRVSDRTRLQDALVAAGATVTLQGNDGLSVIGLAQDQIGETAAAHGLVVYELRTHGHNLEDVFLQLTNKGADDDPR